MLNKIVLPTNTIITCLSSIFCPNFIKLDIYISDVNRKNSGKKKYNVQI
jgi:hypothetical protein